MTTKRGNPLVAASGLRGTHFKVNETQTNHTTNILLFPHQRGLQSWQSEIGQVMLRALQEVIHV